MKLFNFHQFYLFVLILLLNCPVLISQEKSQNSHAMPQKSISVQDISTQNESQKLPVFSNNERDSLKTAVKGMVIFNSTINKPQYFDGETWYCFHNDHYIGERFGGGIVFFVDASGKHGLIASSVNQSISAKWGFFEKPVEANDKSLWAGKSNTEKISKISQDKNIAARLCSDLVLNGFDDWYLPSMDELNLLYTNLKAAGIGKLSDELYWSSSETDFNNAWLQDFKTGVQKEHHVNKSAFVRAIRSF